MIDDGLRYPLHWPRTAGPRTPAGQREESRFKLTLYGAAEELKDELRRMGADYVVISTNIRPRNKAGELPSEYSLRGVDDPGAAVYFMIDREAHEIGCDKWTLVEDNIRAIGKTIEAMRGVERWGSSKAMKQAMSGFKALPAAGTDWRATFGLTKGNPTMEHVKAKYRELARGAHPDKQGGNQHHMIRLNQALEAAKAELDG